MSKVSQTLHYRVRVGYRIQAGAIIPEGVTACGHRVAQERTVTDLAKVNCKTCLNSVRLRERVKSIQ